MKAVCQQLSRLHVRRRTPSSTILRRYTSHRPMSTALPHETDERIIDVSNLAGDMRQAVRDYTMAIDSSEDKVKLMGILAHDGPSRDDAELYSEFVGYTCQEDGIDYEVQRVMGPRPQDVEAAIREANERGDVHGILVYYPIFKRPNVASVRGPYKNRLTGVYYRSSDDYLRDVVSSKKDVEGLSHSYNARGLYRDRATDPDSGETVVYPCTALSVYKILEAQQEDLSGRTITVVNRSEILGRPLAAMLASNGAHVYSIDADSVLLFRPGGRLRRVTDMTLEKCLQSSSIVVSAVPSASFTLPSEYINPGSTVVNVSEFENVKEESILEIPEVRFVPHVGKVTIAALEQNLIHLHRNRDKI